MRRSGAVLFIIGLCIVGPVYSAEVATNTKLDELGDNSWLYMSPKVSTRSVPTQRNENTPLKEVSAAEPSFREYTSPVLGDGKIFYFGGGHSGYAGNDVEMYDPVANVWKQCYLPHCPPKDDSTYYSGGSERAFVDAETGELAPYVIHGYARTTYHPVLHRYVCTAMFCTKAEKDAASGKWTCAKKAYSLITFDPATFKWEWLAEGPRGDLSEWDTNLGGLLNFDDHRVRLFKDGVWKDYDSAPFTLSGQGGAHSVYLPEQKAHLISVMPHGGAREEGHLYLYQSAEKKCREIPSVPDELKQKFRPLGNCVFAYDGSNHLVIAMTTDGGRVKVWTWDPAADAWQKLPDSPSAPEFAVFEPGSPGRAPLMYDAVRKVLFLMTGNNKDGVKTWAYRFKKG